MTMLDDLKEVLDDIEASNDWEYQFVTSIAERVETNANYKLSGKQFEVLNRLHQKYVKRW